MHTADPSAADVALFIERLHQAIRVIDGLAEQTGTVLDIGVYAVLEGDILRGCIAGLCGLDPWFQSQGLTTHIGRDLGSVSASPRNFFGTEKPFFPSDYCEFLPDNITPETAIAALRDAISSFEAVSSPVRTNPA